MLEKPDLADSAVAACLRDAYGLRVRDLAFLPLGFDVGSAVYRVAADDGTPYFLKLRRGVFDETTVAVPQLLHARGIGQVIAPIATAAGPLWTTLDGFNAVLYPFVEGRSGFEVDLTDRQCVELGAVLKAMHATVVPPALRRRIPHESYAPRWRDRVRSFQVEVERTTYADPVAADLAAFMRGRRDRIRDLVERAERLTLDLPARSPEFVLCHADIHAGNVLLGAGGALYVVDWDTLTFAPKERDLMFVGAGLGIGDSAEQAALFYRGYGQAEIDAAALAYYRFERIVEDIAAFCEQLLSSDAGGADREPSLRYFVDSFRPGNVVERAYRSAERLPADLK